MSRACLPIVIAALCLLGCESKKPDDGTPAGGTAGPRPAAAAAPMPANPGVTDTEIVIGQAAGFSGPSTGLGVEMWRGASAAFSATNDAGGVHGRKIKLVLSDDGYDAEKAAPAVVKLIEQERVFALFAGVGTPTIVRALPVVRKYYDEAGLFYFGNFTGAQPQRQPPYAQVVFNVRASYYQETKAIVDAYVALGRKKIGTFVQDDAYGTDGREGTKLALKAHGLDLVADTRYPRGQKFDVSTKDQVKILRDAGVDAVVCVGSYQADGAFIRDAREAGWNVPIHNVSFVGADQMLSLLKEHEAKSGKKLIDNVINTQVVPHYNDESVPAVKEYRAVVDKYQPTVPPGVGDGSYKSTSKYSFGSLEGFITAKAFVAVLEKTGKELTRKSFYATAESMGAFDLGVGAPAEFSATRHQALDKVWLTYATPDGWKPTETLQSVIK